MSSITIRNLDPAIKERRRVRAAEHGHSMEAEARDILQSAMEVSPADLLPKRTGADLVARIRARFEPLGSVELELPVQSDFAGQILLFDTGATASYAGILISRRRMGRPVSTEDLMIAACRPLPSRRSSSRVSRIVITC